MKAKVIISEKAHADTHDYFIQKDFEIITFKSQNKAYQAVCHHPDMFVFYDDHLFVERDTDLEGIKCSPIGERYPETVKFNIAKVGNYIICKYDAIDDTIKKHIIEKQYTVIDVKQGYAKCSTAVIDDAIITSDKGIYKACKPMIKVLLIEAGHIDLQGLDYGFIGGATVCFDQTVFFNGDITKHPNYKNIKSFVESLGKTIEHTKEPLTDIGSFIIIERSE